jgi:outer membrane protein assembly factor BamB
MKKLLYLISIVTLCTASLQAAPRAEHWHQWRGPEASGVSRTARPPLEWSETKNIRWKVPIDGHGSSTPIIWGDRVFLLTAIDTGQVDPSLPRPEDQPKRVFGITHPNTSHQFVVLCLDRATGKERWRRIATEKVPHEGHHGDNNFASASPFTDGERLYCWFGSAGLFCYDLDGTKLWERDLGRVHMGASLGEGTSPVVHDDKLVLVRDHSRQSWIETLDAKTGKTLWRKERDEGNTWATPAVVAHGGRTQVITPGSNRIRSYDLHTGDILWQCGGLTGNPIPCPVVQDGVVYCMTGYQGHALLALPLSARGDISATDAILWKQDRGTPYIPSPLLYDGLLWFNQSNQNLLSCVDAQTGEVVIDRVRLPGVRNIYASPVGVAGRVYVVDRDGTTLVLKQARALTVLATNKLDDLFLSSPALAGGQLFLRGKNALYCIAEKE